MKRIILILIALLGLAGPAMLPVSASARAVSCRWPWPGNTQVRPHEYIADISARNMTCGAAVRGISHGYWLRGDYWKGQSVFRTRGFHCYVISFGGGGQTVRCVSRVRAFRFSWGT